MLFPCPTLETLDFFKLIFSKKYFTFREDIDILYLAKLCDEVLKCFSNYFIAIKRIKNQNPNLEHVFVFRPFIDMNEHAKQIKRTGNVE